MKTYYLLLKSHCLAPDYEAEVEADNKDEAIEKFLEDSALRDFDKEMLKGSIGETP